MSVFKFELNQAVGITNSEEHGIVVSRAEHTRAEHTYMVRYKCGDGRMIEEWWTESALHDNEPVNAK
jgi:hypothetical protein